MPSIKDDKILGRIASMESELGKLGKDHQETVRVFNQKVAENQKKHQELIGGIAALKSLLAEPKT